VKVTPQMVEGSVPLIYNRVGNPAQAYQLVERFTKAVEFWASLPLLEFGKTVVELVDDKKSQVVDNNNNKKIEL
jgi:hypothetical protein